MNNIVDLLSEWLTCPSCGSGDVTVSISFPSRGVSISCDDCRRRDAAGEDGVERGQPADHHPASADDE